MSTKLHIIRGDTVKYKFQRLTCSGEVITTPPEAIYFTVKESPEKQRLIFQKTMDDMTFDEDGTFHLVILPEDTNGLWYGQYVYDIEVIYDGVKSTIAFGDVEILPEVTWVENEEES